MSVAPKKGKTDGFAIAAIICSILGLGSPLLAISSIVLGVVALSRIRKDPSKQGAGLAKTSIVLGILGAFILTYFGVLNPEQFLPRRCVLGSEIQCVDYAIQMKSPTAATMAVRLGNGIDNPITIKSICVTDTLFKSQLGQSCVSPAIQIQPGTNIVLPYLEFNNVADLKSGTPIRGYINVTYQDLTTGFNHIAMGDFVTKVE